MIVEMDGLWAHKGARVRELVEGRGCELLDLLPPYPPDLLNPIEEAFFSKIKGILRKAGARSREAALVEAMGSTRRSMRSRVSGRERLLRALRIPGTGSTVVTAAVTVVC